ncbi:MAG: VCBS repeat-containing protein, partial [Myxococcota bacterium]|nr:VCBS repeat-containing protein [Myxococcota bacterium]
MLPVLSIGITLVGVACHSGHTDGADTAGPVDTGEELHWVSASLDEGETVTCSDPESREAAAMDAWELGEDWQGLDDSANLETQYGGSGLAVADWTGDGALDLVLPGVNGTRLFVAQDDGTWIDEAEDRLPELGLETGVGAVTADVDGDGDLDLYLTGLREPNVLLLNDGTGTFTDGTESAGVGGGDWDSISGAFGDWDGDGDLDLAVANHREDGQDLYEGLLAGELVEAGHPNVLYRSGGDGSFEDATDQLPTEFVDAFSFLLAWHDLDGDGDLDLYAVNDFGHQWQSNGVLWNRDGVLETAENTGLEVSAYSMGLGVGDVGGDGHPDLLISSWGDLVLLESDGVGGWYEAAASRGLMLDSDTRQVGWGSELVDLDNDGDLDALVAFGRLVIPSFAQETLEEQLGLVDDDEQPDGLWLQAEDGSFEQVAETWGLADTGVGRGFVVVDLDRDGWLDLVKRQLDGAPLAYRA